MTDYIPHTAGLSDRGLQRKFVPLNKRTDEVTIGGVETFYSSECTAECESCRKNLRVEVNCEYGDGWIDQAFRMIVANNRAECWRPAIVPRRP